MTLQVGGAINLASRQLSRQDITGADTLPLFALNLDQVAVYAGQTVGLHRQSEIIDTWIRLFDYANSIGLILQNGIGVATSFYLIVDIDTLGEINYRVSAVVDDILANDVAIGIQATVNAEFKEGVIPINTAFEQIRQFALENFFKAA